MNIKAAKFVQNLRGLKPSEKAVALNIAVHADVKNCEATMSMKTLADESGLRKRETASRIVKKLETIYGVIQAVGSRSGGKRPTKYTFTFAVNRDSGITVIGQANRDSDEGADGVNRDFGVGSIVTQNAPTVTGESHEGFKGLKEKKEKEQSLANSAPAHSSFKSTAAGRKYAKDLVDEIKKVAMSVSDGKAVFYGKHRQAIEAVILEYNPDRADVLAAVRARVLDMNGDSFRLSHCGSELAECLPALVQYKADEKAARERQEADARASIEAGHAKFLKEQAELLRKRAEEDELAERFAKNPFGDDAFGAPAEPQAIPASGANGKG